VSLCRHKFKFTGIEEESDHLSKLLQCDVKQLKDLIRTHHVTINDHIKFSSLIKFFDRYNPPIFTGDEMHDFKNELIPDGKKTTLLIDYLLKKNENGVHSFLRSLHQAKEHSGHSVILKEMSMQLDCNRQSCRVYD